MSTPFEKFTIRDAWPQADQYIIVVKISTEKKQGQHSDCARRFEGMTIGSVQAKRFEEEQFIETAIREKLERERGEQKRNVSASKEGQL